MKLTLRPECDPRSLGSFIGFIDIKTGAKIVVLFAIINKVAGVYGLIAVLTGAGGSLAQLSMYIYSIGALGAFSWCFQGISEEDSRKALITAHYFIADHVINTLWLVIFSVDWWFYNPHDGSHPPFSPAQQGIADVGPGHGPHMTDEQRYAAAQSIWQREKGTSAAVLAVGWLIKWYFAAVLYSYAFHLQRGTYRSLPLTITASQRGGEDYVPLFENELGDTNDDGEGRLPAQSSRDIDFDADFDDLDGEDLERGRVRGRGPGSIGGYGEMVSATRPKAKATAPPAVTSGRPHRVSYNKPPSASVSQRVGSNQTSPDKGKSRAIQRELERNGEVQKWDDEDDEDVSTSKTSEPSASESRPSIRSPPR